MILSLSISAIVYCVYSYLKLSSRQYRSQYQAHEHDIFFKNS